MPADWVQAVTLEGKHVRLEPLELHHADSLVAAASDASIWQHMLITGIPDRAAAEKYIQEARRPSSEGGQAPFAAIDRRTGQVAGSTRYLSIVPEHRTLEIGWTWLGAVWRRTAVNTECKLLLLRHAFEALNAIRVQFRTDIRNIRSQTAIERIGGVREGVLRSHRIRPDGSFRDTVVYSILPSEWPTIRSRLEGRLAAPVLAVDSGSGQSADAGRRF